MANTPSYAERQAHLNTGFAFTCTCELCSLPLSSRRLSDRRWNRIIALDRQMADPFRLLASPISCLRGLREMLRLLKEEGYEEDTAVAARTYYDAFQVATINGDQARAEVSAQRAYAGRVVRYGEDDATVIEDEGLWGQPGIPPDIRQDAEVGAERCADSKGREFEDWLWKEGTDGLF